MLLCYKCNFIVRGLYKYPIDMVDVNAFCSKEMPKPNQTLFFIILAMHLEYLKCDRGKKIH